MGKSGFTFAVEKNESSTGPKQRFEYFSPGEDPTTVRLLTIDKDDSIVTYQEHFVIFKNNWKKSVSCPDFENDGPRKCILCKIGTGQGIQQNNYNTKYLMQGIVRGDEDKIKVVKISSLLMTALIPYIRENGDLGDRDYNISLVPNPDTNSKLKKVYVVEPASKKATPLSSSDKALAETKYNLSEVEPAYNEEELLRMINMEPASSPAQK